MRVKHARPLHPEALAFVPFGIVLVRVRVRVRVRVPPKRAAGFLFCLSLIIFVSLLELEF